MSETSRERTTEKWTRSAESAQTKSYWLRAFPQELDRSAFVLYFLGGVVPLVALGVVVERYQLTSVSDGYAVFELLGAVLSITALSLGCFMMLRSTVSRALRQMEASNRRLSGLLAASRSLSAAQHGDDAGNTVVRSAIALTGAQAACVFLRPKRGGALEMATSSGASGAERYESLIKPLYELADLVTIEGRPAFLGSENKRGDPENSAIGSAVVVPLPGQKDSLGALAVIHTEPGRSFTSAEVDAVATLAGLASVATINADLRFSQRNFFTHVTDILVTAIDIHLDYHGGHGRRVAHLANRLAHQLGLDEAQSERLHFAALLHDIGMLKIDRSVPHSSKICEKHPIYGFRMLSGIRLWDDVAPLILYHHERFDGSGYPEGLAGEEIPLEARIIAVCEAFDSMTALTSYKDPVPTDAAVREIEAGAGSQFDPVVVRAFLETLECGMIDGT